MSDTSTGAPLTAREEQCLRLVADGLLTDEIARQLDLSPHTINKYVEAAMRKLGDTGRGRRAVARDFVKLHPGTPEQLVPEPLGIEALSSNRVEAASSEGRGEADEVPSPAPETGWQTAALGRLPFRLRGQRSRSLSAVEVLIWVPVLALMMLISLGVALGALETTSRLRHQGLFGGLFPSGTHVEPRSIK